MYRISAMPWSYWVGQAVLLVGALILVTAVGMTRGEFPFLFVGMVTASWVAVGWAFGVAYGYELSVSETTLRWRSALVRRSARLDEVEAVLFHPHRQLIRSVVVSGRSWRVFVPHGGDCPRQFDQFVEELLLRCPGLRIDQPG